MSRVIAQLGDEDVGRVLSVPPRVRIRFQESFTSDYRKKLLDYFMKYSHCVNWNELSSRLYREKYFKAALVAKRFASGIPGMYT